MTNYTGYRAVALTLVDLKYSLPGSLHYTAEYSVVRHSSLCAGCVTSTVREGVTFKKTRTIWDKGGGVGSDPNPSFCSEFPFFRSHKLSFPILQNMCNSENLT